MFAGVRRAGRLRRDRGVHEPVEVVALGLVELEGVADAVEDAVGDAADVAALEPGVVLDADAGEEGDLFAAQAGDAAVRAVHGQPGLLRGDLGAARGEELPQVVLGGHAIHATHVVLGLGVPASTPLNAVSHGVRAWRCLVS